MDRSEGTQVAVGGALLGTGGVVIAILVPLAVAASGDPWFAAWFLIPCVLASLVAVTGFYMLAAVYTGWPLPTTSAARAAAPDLVWLGSRVVPMDETILNSARECVI